MESQHYNRHHFDLWLLFAVIVLVAIGVTMVYSASAVLALERFDDSYFFLKRTLLFVGVGFVLLSLMTRLDYHVCRRWIYVILFASVVLVLAVFVPGMGRTIGGATRWIHLGPFAFQPSEFAKVVIVVYFAYSLEKKTERMGTFSIGMLPHLIMMIAACALVLSQRDFGAAAIIAVVTWLLLFSAGAPLKYLMGTIGAMIPAVILLILQSPYRLKRIVAFLNPWDDRFGSGFQMIQSFVAFNEGGWFGKGLGQGQQKLFYLPEAHTDFIFSVIGEELGLLGVLLVIALFAFLCYRGFFIALRAPDLFGRYVALGCTLLVGIEALFNMAVVMGLLPTKGLTLPFISYGGSSLVVSLVAVGIILSVSSYRKVAA